MVWGTVAENAFDWGLKRIDYHEPDDGQSGGGGTGRGVDLVSGRATDLDIYNWNEWMIRVTDTGCRVYVRENGGFKLLGQTSDATFIHEPYFGVFMASSEQARVGYQWEWFEVTQD